MAKKILILYPHFPPSNLAGVHRPRLFAQHLATFGWEPVILTVHEQFYEEALDLNLAKLLPANLRIEKSNAFQVTQPRLIGDIGLRAFFQLYRKAKKMIVQERFDFLYIPIPSFYLALLGRWLHRTIGIAYGIDYIDPWVHQFPGSKQTFSRHWWSTKLAQFLEPIAIKNASLITGVAAGYYQPVLDRNPHLKLSAIAGAMPYGGEAEDHEALKKLQLIPYLFGKNAAKFQLVYAGAMLPKAYQPLEAIFSAMSINPDVFEQVEFHFIGTGSRTNDDQSFNIKPLAEKYGLWQKQIFEYPKRIPYLDVLIHLDSADAIFILGSTEPHYTPSKTYQGVLSGKPIAAVLHQESSAVSVVQQSKAGKVLAFNGEIGLNTIKDEFVKFFQTFHEFYQNFNPNQINYSLFEQYSAKNITGILAQLLDQAVALPKTKR